MDIVDAQEYWSITYNQLELQFDRATFDTWLRGTFLLGVEDNGRMFVIGVRNEYAREMLQHRLYRNIRRVLCDVCGSSVELRFEVARQPRRDRSHDDEMPLFRLLAQQHEEPPVEIITRDIVEDPPIPLHERIARPQRPALPESDLNPAFTFSRFVVNDSNRITYEAARAVAEAPGRTYNPFVVYGGVGLGKTHLLQAIAHECEARGLKVIYVPSEAFTNDLVDSIRNKTTAMFRDRYRSVDVLLVDDIQFIAGKDSTQEEFFHTFNALYTFNKQIVLASDRHPHELTTLEDRLRSRFEGGLVSDIAPLEFESRLAILSMWAQERGIQIESAILDLIASKGQGNVRELEGLFNQMVAQLRFKGRAMTVPEAEYNLGLFQSPREHRWRRVTLQQVIETSAKYFQIDPADLAGPKRSARVNRARQVSMYLARELTDLSLPQIGDALGGRSHTTVLHGCNKIMDELELDEGLRNQIMQIREELGDFD